MKSLIFTILLLSSSLAISCPNPNGTWKSSKEMSMKYNKKHAELDEVQVNFLEQILGHMELSITQNKIVEHELPTIQVRSNGEVNDFKFERSEYHYKTIECNENSITTEYNHPYAGKQTSIAHFVNKDTYWVSPELLPSTREYFVRINK